MEVYSIDECFLDVTATQDHFGGAWEIARAIKHRIRADMGLTCSIGIGPNKILAKLASGMKKPDGLTEIRREEVESLLENLPVEELHGIGEKTRLKLLSMGIATAGALGRVPKDRLRRTFGILGDVLQGLGNGSNCSPVIPYHSEPDIKSVGHSYTLAHNTRDKDIIHRQLLRLSEMVGRRLREYGHAGRTVTLVLRYEDMHTFTRRKSIREYLDDGYDIYQAALSILNQQDEDERAIRLIGVSVSNLVKKLHQLNLFAHPRQRELLKTLDAINDKYGEFTIKRASLIDIDARPKTHGFERKRVTQQVTAA
jgi:DNA polymerase-4